MALHSLCKHVLTTSLITKCLSGIELLKVTQVHPHPNQHQLVAPMGFIRLHRDLVMPNVQKLRFPASLVTVALFVPAPIFITAATVPENMFSPAIVVAANIIIAFVTRTNMPPQQTVAAVRMERRQIHQNLVLIKPPAKLSTPVAATLAMVWQTTQVNLAVINIMTNARANVSLAAPANQQTALPTRSPLAPLAQLVNPALPAVATMLKDINALLKVALVTRFPPVLPARLVQAAPLVAVITPKNIRKIVEFKTVQAIRFLLARQDPSVEVVLRVAETTRQNIKN